MALTLHRRFPTGMKIGVWTRPCGRCSVPARTLAVAGGELKALLAIWPAVSSAAARRRSPESHSHRSSSRCPARFFGGPATFVRRLARIGEAAQDQHGIAGPKVALAHRFGIGVGTRRRPANAATSIRASIAAGERQ